MPIVRATRAAVYNIADGTTIEIPGVIYVAYQLVRQVIAQEDGTVVPGLSRFYGELGIDNMESALELFDRTIWFPIEEVNPSNWPRYDLSVYFTEGIDSNKILQFEDIMTGVSASDEFRGDTLGTIEKLVDAGDIQVQKVAFQIRNNGKDRITNHIKIISY